MTAARLQRKQSMRVRLALLVLAVVAVPATSGGGTTERVVADWRTGLAISGFDPVGYFTDAAAKIGRPELEYPYAGVTWRFGNEGNRAAFAGHPDIYLPRFGGHDPVGVARGVARPGHPEFWLIVEQRLYLFYGADARDAFRADPDRIAAAAEELWPEVLRSLSP
jgi:hypothetical protein